MFYQANKQIGNNLDEVMAEKGMHTGRRCDTYLLQNVSGVKSLTET